jgi:hypothetical protein
MLQQSALLSEELATPPRMRAENAQNARLPPISLPSETALDGGPHRLKRRFDGETSAPTGPRALPPSSSSLPFGSPLEERLMLQQGPMLPEELATLPKMRAENVSGVRMIRQNAAGSASQATVRNGGLR